MRRRYNKGRRSIPMFIFEMYRMLPWPIGLLLAGAIYIYLQYYLPNNYIVSNEQGAVQQQIIVSGIDLLQKAAPFIAFAFVVATVSAGWHSHRKKKMLDKQVSKESIALLNPLDFEYLVSEAYKRQGFKVIENDPSGASADGGIDLLLKKRGQTFIVQCKHYKSRSVGVPIVREMYGLLVSESYAKRMIIVTSGEYSIEALKFARGKPMDLIAGDDLLALIQKVQKKSKIEKPKMPESIGNTCPQCKTGTLVQRKAKKGPYKGKKFTGCSNFPRCKYSNF